MDWVSAAAQYAASLNMTELESSAEWYAGEYNVSSTAASLSDALAQYKATEVEQAVRAGVEHQLDLYNASGSVKAIQEQTDQYTAKAHRLAAAATGMQVDDVGGMARQAAGQYLAEHPELGQGAAKAASQAGIPLSFRAPLTQPTVAGGSAALPVAVCVLGAAMLLLFVARRRRRALAARPPAQELV
eukprot:scaffold9552_cov113-Isochrysis_galbana.AAC.3